MITIILWRIYVSDSFDKTVSVVVITCYVLLCAVGAYVQTANNRKTTWRTTVIYDPSTCIGHIRKRIYTRAPPLRLPFGGMTSGAAIFALKIIYKTDCTTGDCCESSWRSLYIIIIFLCWKIIEVNRQQNGQPRIIIVIFYVVLLFVIFFLNYSLIRFDNIF